MKFTTFVDYVSTFYCCFCIKLRVCVLLTTMPVECEQQMDNFEIESDNEEDLNDEIIKEEFSVLYHLENEVAVSIKKSYILHISGSSVSNDRVAIALSDQSCAVYDLNQLKRIQNLHYHKNLVTNIRFSPEDENLVYSSSHDGTIKLWDIRLKNTNVKEFKDDSDGPDMLKPLSDFDISYNHRFICAGTELIDGDAFLLFWDIRSTNLLGGYWESHKDDITQVKFHPNRQDVLASGSTDGLISVFEINQSSEDDALQQSLNTESSVEKVFWFPQEDSTHVLACITHTEDLQFWNIDGAAPYLKFPRSEIAKSMQRKSTDDCFVINVHETNKPEETIVLTASTAGRGECLRTLGVCNNNLKPLSDLQGNKQIVRASWYCKNNGIMITGGESGILSLWKPGKGIENTTSSDLKIHSKQDLKHQRRKPY